MVSYSEALSSKFPALVQTSDAAGTHGFVRGCHLYRFLGCVLVLYGDLWAFWACLGMSGHSGCPVYCTEYVGRSGSMSSRISWICTYVIRTRGLTRTDTLYVK